MKREFVTATLDKLLSGFQGNDSGNAPVLLMLGGFKFSLNTAVFQEIQQSNEFRWQAQERVGQLAALQYTGPGQATMTLPGVLNHEFRGKGNQMSELRRLAAQGKPQRLLTGRGGNLGLWVIDKIEATSKHFTPDGDIRQQTFTLSLRKHSHGTNV
ncbi:TPA: phage tail protein [Stenotrophomonas maltophilia]|nr:phage tail protein [Stenotrophomonas maltophilia]HEL4237778.1 phage tail protein [Stenotrophomonas maltophilia]